MSCIIIYTGKINIYRGSKQIQIRTPEQRIPRLRRSGTKVYQLPDGKKQLQGFEHPDAEELLRLWPRVFKRQHNWETRNEHTAKRKR